MLNLRNLYRIWIYVLSFATVNGTTLLTNKDYPWNSTYSNIFPHCLKIFYQKIEALAKTKNVAPEPKRSPEINELTTALAKAQSEMKSADLNKTNPYFKSSYADLQSIVNASRGPLTKNGLSVTQQLYDEYDASWLITTLWHTSGQWITSKRRVVPAKNDIQTISSHTTYLKRMSYASLIGVVTGEDDDDGEAAVATQRETYAKGVALNTKYNPKENKTEIVSKDQLDEL